MIWNYVKKPKSKVEKAICQFAEGDGSACNLVFVWQAIIPPWGLNSGAKLSTRTRSIIIRQKTKLNPKFIFGASRCSQLYLKIFGKVTNPPPPVTVTGRGGGPLVLSKATATRLIVPHSPPLLGQNFRFPDMVDSSPSPGVLGNFSPFRENRALFFGRRIFLP